MLISRLDSITENFSQQLDQLLSWDDSENNEINTLVQEIILRVRQQGDAALLEYTNRFDCRHIKHAKELLIESPELQAALARISDEQAGALQEAAARIESYHLHQKQNSWQYREQNGTVLGQKITPLDRVGLYAPGGKAAYPSSILMAAVPAKVAGVPEVVLVTPCPQGEVNDIVLAAAAVAGVNRVITIGGAQAVAALAYGTDTVPKVDKIVGPGNVYVASAKRQVFGTVDIDMIAGPSEILVICDGKTDPDWIAMDLFSQAEHDENAQSILLCPDADYIERVYASIEKLLPTLERKEITAISLRERGALIKVKDLNQAVELANRIAPEHLELSVEDPEVLVDDIRHAGAIFMGRHTSESLGDYCAGPNHVLPTSGTARFSSPLGVYDYVKRSSIIYCSPEGASELGAVASVLARGESLEAHARSAEYRIKKQDIE
ncbi:histidinol dehydrogenase [Alteromonadaceae bacterium Bs31]|nr:histidinol dehydrogenase [Alteromonadaceae bacterium Bs31]